MIRTFHLSRFLTFVMMAGSVAAAHAGDAATVFAKDIKPLLETHCVSCHGPMKRKAGVDLSLISDEAGVQRDRSTWRKVVDQLASKEMPPEDAKSQPSEAERQRLAGWAKATLTAGSAALAKDPGPAPLRRLTRDEYGRTVRDLLGITVDVAEAVGLPSDNERGFATYAGTLTMPPLLFEKFYTAADRALEALVEPAVDAPTPARRAWDAVFIAKPGATPSAKKEAARIIIQAFARRAYRRPVQPEELSRLLKTFDVASATRDFVPAIKLVFKGILVSPSFLYRSEQDRGPKNSADGYPVTDHELAVRLSYLLWSTMPDTELSELADRGKLSEPSALTGQVKRMLADSRAQALTSGFFATWLQIDHLDRARPSQQNFPSFTPELRRAMYDETARFVDELRLKDGRLLDLLDCDYAFVNEELATHYGIAGDKGIAGASGIKGKELRRVALNPGDHRGGVLGMGSVLAMTSHTYRTSPTLRGKWVLEVLLGAPPPPPPANVKPIEEAGAKQEGAAAKTFRDQLAAHVTDPACANCHRKMDPLGFALDGYDAVGVWREGTKERPLDTSGKLPSGESFAGAGELKKVLWSKRDRFTRTLVEQFLLYAMGRDLGVADERTVDAVVERLSREDSKFSALITGVVTSFPFLNRRNADLPPVKDTKPAAVARP